MRLKRVALHFIAVTLPPLSVVPHSSGRTAALLSADVLVGGTSLRKAVSGAPLIPSHDDTCT